MSEAQLVACPTCARHARASEAACPFCGAAFAEKLRATPERPGPAIRLSRAALVAVGAAIAASPAACSSSSTPVQIAPPYGGAPFLYDGKAPDGIVFGTTTCSGDVYFVLGDGWGFCDAGVWEYTYEDPTGFGNYSIDTAIVESSTSSETASSTSGGSGTTSSTAAADGGSGPDAS